MLAEAVARLAAGDDRSGRIVAAAEEYREACLAMRELWRGVIETPVLTTADPNSPRSIAIRAYNAGRRRVEATHGALLEAALDGVQTIPPEVEDLLDMRDKAPAMHEDTCRCETCKVHA